MNPNNYSNRTAKLFSQWMACAAIAVMTIYSISADAQTCTSPATADITDTAAHICAGGMYTLNGTFGGSATSATWTSSGTGTFDSTAVATAGVKYVPSSTDVTAGSVVLTLTTDDPDGSSGPCLAASDSIVLYIHTPANVVISGSLYFCPGGFTSLTSSSSTGNLWSTGSTDAGITVSSAGNYSVTVTDANGCITSSSVNVVANAAPVPTISGATSICTGSSTTLTSSSAASYLWSDSSTGSSISTGTPGTYSVTVTDASGCTGSASATVTVNSNPTVAVSGNTTICSGSTTTLTASGGASYVWAFNGSTTASVTVGAAGTYSVLATDANGCTGSASQTVTVNTNPVASISGISSICPGGSTTLTASGGLNYFWAFNGSTTAAVTVSPSSTTPYTVVVTDANGCTGSASITVTVNTASVSISGASVLCTGGSGTLTAAATPAAVSYAWTLNGNALPDITASITATLAGNYVVSTTDANGCTATASKTVTQAVPFTVSVAASCANSTWLTGNQVTFTATPSPSGTYTHSWTGGLGTGATSTQTNTAGTYTDTVRDANGCSVLASYTLAGAPLNGTYTISGSNACGSFSTLKRAIDHMNAYGISGPVTINMGVAETAPAGGYAITATGTASNPIVIHGQGFTVTASNVHTVGSVNDAIFKIIGGDYITIRNFVMTENSGNTTSATAATNNMTEFGVALFHTSVTDGAQYNTIQGNSITLNRAYLNTIGIYSTARTSATSMTAANDATTAAGANSYNKVYGNTIANVMYGIAFIGANNMAGMDYGNELGGAAVGQGNTITNWGGATTTTGTLTGFVSLTANNYCIFSNQQLNNTISRNTITSAAALSEGAVAGGILVNYSVLAPTGVTTTTDITYNTVTVTNAALTAASGGVIGINTQGITTLLPTATINITNNTVTGCRLSGTVATTIGLTGITNLSLAGTVNINNNTLTNNQITTTTAVLTGSLAMITNSGAAGTLNINSNTITGNAIACTTATSALSTGIYNSGAVGTLNIGNNIINTFSSAATSGQVQVISSNAAAVVNAINITNNKIGNSTSALYTSTSATASSGAFYGIYASTGSATCAVTMTGNTFGGNITYTAAATAAQYYFYNTISGGAAAPMTISNDTIALPSGVNTSGTIYGFYLANSTPNGTVSGNLMNNYTRSHATAGGTFYGYYWYSSLAGAAGTVQNFNDNRLTNINNGVSSSSFLYGAYVSGIGSTCNFYNNTFNNIFQTLLAAGYGNIYVVTPYYYGSTYNLYNNTISNIAINSTANATTSTTMSNILGIYDYHYNTTQMNIYGNTIRDMAINLVTQALPATPTASTNHGVQGINLYYTGSSAAAVTKIYNNRIFNLRTNENNAYAFASGIRASYTFYGGDVRIYNNMIGGLSAVNSTNASPANGMDLGVLSSSSGTAPTYDIAHNTIYMDTLAGGTGAGFSGIYASMTYANLKLRNNVIICKGTASSTGRNVCLRLNSTTYTNYNTASNNNLFYAGPASGTNYIFSDGTNHMQTLAAFQALTGISPRETSSYTEDVAFQSTNRWATYNPATWLHVNTTTPTFVESGGQSIPAITDDIDGNTRNTLSPDMGADEGTFTGKLPAITSISSTPTAPQCTAVPHSVTVTTSAGVTGVTLSYSLDNVAQTPIAMTNSGGNTWTAAIPASGSAVVTFNAVATNGTYNSGTVQGTGYQDNYLSAAVMVAAVSPTTICAGSSVALNSYLTSSSTAPTTYGAANATSTADEEILNVTFKSINNSSICGTLAPGAGSIAYQYSDYTGLAAPVVTTGEIVNFSVQVGTCGSNYTNRSVIYIDWNRDGDFLDANETAAAEAAGVSGPHTWSGTITAPAAVTTGYTRMRVITNETSSITPPTGTFSWGEVEDYTLQLASASGFTFAWSVNGTSFTPVNNAYTLASAGTYNFQVAAVDQNGCTVSSSPVAVTVNPIPTSPSATNSTQCGVATPAASVSSTSGAATPTFNWYNPVMRTYYSNNFSSGLLTYSSPLTNTVVTGVLSGSASQTGGLVQLTPNTTSQQGGLTIPASGVNGRDYSIAFTIATSAAANVGADGLSYSFGDDANATSTNPTAENGSGTKLQLCFDSYDASGAGVMGIRLKYGQSIANPGSTAGSNNVLAYSSNTSWCNTSSSGGSNVVLTINSLGQATVTLGGTAIFTNVQLPAAYLSADKATWKHVFAARTGGASQIHSVDNIVIQQSSVVQQTSTTWPTAISSTTSWYVSEVSQGCESSPVLLTATVNSPDLVSISTDSASSVCPGVVVTLTANNVGTGTNLYNYHWYRTNQGGVTTDLNTGNPLPDYQLATLPPGTYTYSVTANEPSSGCNTTATTTLTVRIPPSINASATPSAVCSGSTVSLLATTTMIVSGPQTGPSGYGASAATSTADEEILNVTFKTLNNSSACGALAPGAGSAAYLYSNYTGSVAAPTVTINETVSFSVQIGTCGGNYGNRSVIYIDWNRDGDFLDANETAATEAASVSGPHTWSGTIVVPSASVAVAGVTRMRVITVETSGVQASTGTYTWGETEDYHINILSNGQGAGTYNWQWSDGTTTISPNNNVSNSITVNPVAPTSYTVVATDPATGCTNSVPVAVTVQPIPSAPVAVNSSQCGSSIPTCSVVGSGQAGSSFRWYTSATGGTPIANETGATLGLTLVSTTTTFYVAESSATTPACESARTPVTVSVTQPDGIEVTASAGPYCLGGTIDLFVADTASSPINSYGFTWTSSSPNSGLSSAFNGTSLSVQPVAAGTYSYTATASDPNSPYGNCQAVVWKTIIINNNPVIDSVNALPNVPVCAGSTINLNAYTVGSGPQTLPTGYCAGTPGTIFADEQIFGVSFASMNNLSQGETCGANYTDYSGTIAAPTIVAGSSYPFSVVTNECDGAAYFSSGLSIFFDWNRDGDFLDAGETAYTTTATTISPNTRSGTITVPSTAVAGKTKMRVVVQESVVSPTSCPSISYGEFEDYAVNILALSTGGNTWSWSPGGMTGNQVTATPTTTTTYVATATNAAGCTATASVTKNVLPLPSAPTAVNNTICGFNACNVSVVSTSGAAAPTFKWYLDPTGGTALGGQSGSSLNGYFVNATTNFYVTEFNGNCESSPRTLVVQNVTQPDPITATTSATAVCLPSGSFMLNGTQTGSTNNYAYSWTAVPPVGSGLSGVQLSAVQTLFSNDFTNSTLPSNVTVYGNASITGGVLQVTPNALSQSGAVKITAGGSAADTIAVDFDLIVPQNGADGISYSYSDDGIPTVDPNMNSENGTGSKLKIAFVAYNAGTIPSGGTTAGLPGIYLMYNCGINEQNATSAGVLGYSSDVSWRASATPKHVSFTVGTTGLLNLALNGSPIFTNIQLPAAYVSANKSNWYHIFKARTGAVTEEHSIDNMVVKVAQIQSLPTVGQSITVTPTVAGTYTYYLLGTDGACAARNSVSVTAYPAATPVSAGPDKQVCNGSSISLQVSGGGGGSSTSTEPAGYCAITGAGQVGPINVSINTMNYSSASLSASPYYEFVPASVATTTLVPGTTYTLSVTCASSSSYPTGAIVSAWFDWNRNGVFEATEWFQPYTTGLTGTIQVTVPITAQMGLTRMRIRSRGAGNINGASDGCTTFGSGEGEDHQISIGDPNQYTWTSIPAGFTATGFTPTFGPITVPTNFVVQFNNGNCSSYDSVLVTPLDTPTAPVIVSSLDSICISGSATYSASNITNGSGLQWQYYNTTSAAWTNITDSTRNGYVTGTITPILGDSIIYIRLQSGCGTNYSYSNIDTLQILLPLITSTTNDTVCGIGYVDVMATGNGTIKWYAGSTGNNLLAVGNSLHASITSNTIYWVTANIGSCTAAAGRQPVFAIVTTADPISVTASQSICAGQTVTLTATSPRDTVSYYAYTWVPDTTLGASRSVTPVATTSYTVYGQSADGCASFATTTVTVNPLPTFSSVNATRDTICQGDSTTLSLASTFSAPGNVIIGTGTSVNTTTTYPTPYGQWYGGSHEQYLIKAAELVASGLTAGNFTKLAFQLDAGYTYAALQNFQINIAPTTLTSMSTTFVSTGMVPVFSSSSYTPSATAGWDNFNLSTPFYWDGTSNIIVDVSFLNCSSCSVATCATSYTNNGVVRQTATTFVSTASTYADGDCTVNTFTPTSTISTYSQRPNIRFRGVVGTNVNYSWAPGGQTTPTITVSPTASTTYTVTVTNPATGCTYSGTKSIVVKPFTAPSVTANGPLQFCQGANVVLDAGAGYDGYSWSNGATTQTITATASGNYTVTVSNNNGCTGTASKSINVLPFTAPTITSNVPSICEGVDQAVLSADAGYTSYLWSTGATTRTITVQFGGTYTVTVTGASGCTGSASYTLAGSPAPLQPSIYIPTTDTLYYCWDGVTAGSVFMMADVQNEPVTVWNDPYSTSGDFVLLGIGSGPTDYGFGSHLITITSIGAGGCTNVDSVRLIVTPVPVPVISGNTSFCTSGSGSSTILDAGSGYASYSWSDGTSVVGTARNYSASAVGTYTVTVTTAAGCSNTASVSVTSKDPVTSTTTVTVCDSLVWNGFTYNTSGVYDYNTIGSNGCDSTAILDLTVNYSASSVLTVTACQTYNWNGFVFTESGHYEIYTATANGCDSLASLELTIDTNCTPGLTLQVTAFIEGYYAGSNTMAPVLANEGVANTTGLETDTITIELRDVTDPTIVVETVQALLMVDGTATATLNVAAAGDSYWIAIKHRNALQTWSAAEVLFSANTTYDFTSADTQAYGSNMKEVELGVWAFYSGDINQDEFVDNFDYPSLESDNFSFATGYLATDLNGDGFVDNFDYPFIEANNFNFVYSAHP